MAGDGPDLRLHPPDSGSAADDRLSDRPSSTTEWVSVVSPNGRPSSDARSLDPPRNSDLEHSDGIPHLDESVTTDHTGEYLAMRTPLRTIPAWVRTYEYPEAEAEAEASATDQLLPPQPDDAVIAQHNHSPYATRKPNHSQLDGTATRTPEPGSGLQRERETRWKNFSKSIAYPREPGVEEKTVTPEWLNENHGDYSQPWRGRLEEWAAGDSEDPLRRDRRREIWFKRFHNTLLKSPIVPLVFRLTVWCFSLIALALGGSIQHLSIEYGHPQGPSALMAIIVDAVALVYLVYITWDEYTAKPLGLRSASAKARLVLLDIFFIVFDSANLSLAFDSLSSASGACTAAEINQEIAPKNDAICDRQIALACVLLIALLAWLTTFSISVLRLVERVSPAQ